MFINKSTDKRQEIPKNYVKDTLEHIKNLKLKEKKINGADQKISVDQYEKKLETLVNRSKTTLVFKGITKETYNIIQAKLYQQKRLNALDPIKKREAMVSKSVIAHILTTRLKINAETFNKISLKDIFKNENGDLIVQFANTSNVGFIYSCMKNLEKNDKLSINQYVPPEFYKRFRELNGICKIYRMDNKNTHIRLGMTDYKIYVKEKDDKRSWSEIAPLFIPKELSKFEIGIVYETSNKRKKIDEDIERIDYQCDYCNYLGNSIKQIEYHISSNHEIEDQEYQSNNLNSYDRYGVKTRQYPEVDMFDLQV